MAEALLPWTGTFAALNGETQAAIAQLVKDGGAIVGTIAQIRLRLGNTRALALLREAGTGRIVGFAALKTPSAGYRAAKFDVAGVPLAAFEQAPELGYVVIADDMRGQRLSGALVDEIARQLVGPAFATTDNKMMHSNLARAGFERVGREWQGHKGQLSLWVLDRSGTAATSG